tara:strand:- start:7782 stop:10652 length:2871 start_codon:yes stop_codon:yes gene_type:complete
MKKLGKLEKKVFTYLNRHVSSVANKQNALRILKSDFGFTPEEVLHLYTLWYYSQERDLEEFEYDEEGILMKFINTLSSLDQEGIDKFVGDLYDSGMLDKLLGPDFNANCGGWNSTVPCISFKKDGIQLELDKQTWESNFSGLDDDNIWMYHQAYGYYSNPEEVDYDEFHYVYSNDETIEHLKTLSIMSGKNNWPGKDGKVKDGEVQNFLSKILPLESYDRIVDDWLMEFGIALGRSREAAVRYCYEDQITYNVNTTRCETSDYCIFIHYEDLKTMIVGENLINLSELKGEEVVNDYVSLSDCWYDTWIDDEGHDDCINQLNNSLDSEIERIGEDVDLEELLKQRAEMINMLEKAGFVVVTTTSTGVYYKSKDGKINLHTDHINYKDKKIKFTYEGKNHIIPIEEFSNWIYGTPLDLNESVRVNKKLLKEQTEDINKISIFDFDGTLMKTPDSKEGKKQWEEFYGKKYPHIGWWGKPESLDDAVFDIQPIESTVSDYKKETENPNTFVIMLTGRLPHQSSQVEELLALHNIYFKEYHYKSDGDTLTSKLNTIKSLLNRFPQVKEIEMWEDREAHVIAFEEWGKENGVNIKVNYITDDVVPLNESTESMDTYYEKVSKLLKPPFILNLEKMGFDVYSEVEKVLSHYFDERVYLHDSSATLSDGEIIDPGDYSLTNKVGLIVYEEDVTADWWSIIKYDDNGNEIYYEDSYVGVLDRKKPFNESVEDKLYDKMVGMLKKPPYGDFLLKMGLDKDSMEQIFKKIFGDDVTLRFIDKNNHSEEGTDYYLYVKDGNRNLIYYEKGFVDKSKKPDWQLFDNSVDKKYRDSDGRKRIVIASFEKTELVYDTDLNNWEEAPIPIKKDKFFTESEDKFHKYHTKLSNFVKPPYFKNLNYLGVDFKDWKPVLSMIFDRDIKLDGVTQDRNDIIDSLTGEIIYSESDFGPDKGQTFANYITGEYGDTLD